MLIVDQYLVFYVIMDGEKVEIRHHQWYTGLSIFVVKLGLIPEQTDMDAENQEKDGNAA